LAVFVEGFTEVLFVERLVLEIAGSNAVHIDSRRIRGGKNAPRTMSQIRIVNAATAQDFYLLIIDCGGDSQVKTRIIEEHTNLTNSQYSKIIGIRDVRPSFSHADIPKLEADLPKYIKTTLIPVEFILATMEIEAWFLAEFTHFAKIDPSITLMAIQNQLGFNPELDDMGLRPDPASDLNNCYQIAGKSYLKGDVGTIAALDYVAMYVETQSQVPYLSRLIANIDAFLA
jgi:hypothetical protein